MVIVTKSGINEDQIIRIEERIRAEGLGPHRSPGTSVIVIGVIGSPSESFREQMAVFSGVDRVIRIGRPYTLAGRGDGREDTSFQVGNAKVGGCEGVTMIAGPCTIETREQLFATAAAVKVAGATVLRGGAYKPRTSPYSFQGLALTGLEYLREASEEFDLPTITEVMEPGLVEQVSQFTDILQIGARNSQNYPLLREAGQSGMPVMVKRGPSNTIEEWLLSAEYVMASGSPRVMLCERGIRTFERATRATQDITAIAMAKRLSHLPVIVDPAHGTGKWYLVEALTLAGVAAGADGAMLEVHPEPDKALCDGPQSLTFENFENLMHKLTVMTNALGRPLRQAAPAAA